MAFFISLTFLSGCATIASSLDPQVATEQLAAASHFTKERVPAGIFTLTAFSRLEHPGQPLTIYIEGDGRAWLSKTRISDDPTPFHPMTLELASIDPSPNVVYLARPCQFDNTALQPPCGPEYWSDKRFSEEVIVSVNEAVDHLVKQSGASRVHLVGYSGGGAVAVLLAERRQDVASLRTVAGNLDPEALNRSQELSPLVGSLDPMMAAKNISRVPQRHFIGSKDTVVPGFAAENFLKAAGDGLCAQVTKVDGATHDSGWTERWGELLKLSVSCG